jgi:hypothetical protein
LPDKRKHRGSNPQDVAAFAADRRAALRQAVADLSWLLSHAYAEKSSLKLVGDRYRLTERQRMGVMRCACSDQALARRKEHEVAWGAAAGQCLLLDGYNVLTTVEAALAGGIILEARDGCYRDLASMHGSFRKVAETVPAIELVGRQLAELNVPRCVWYLDRPVSNSGRLKAAIADLAERNGWDWQIELVNSPDMALINADQIAASADSVILDRCGRWFNLARRIVNSYLPGTHIIVLG